MKFRLEDLEWGVEQGLLSEKQASDLRVALQKKYENRPQFTLGHVIYYFGALVVMSAMTWFMVEAWDRLGGPGITFISLAYGLLFFALGRHFWKNTALKIPGGLLITAAVSMTPLIVYGIERWLGWWPQTDPGPYTGFYVWIKGSWIWMEMATVAVGLLALRFFRFPFISFPIAYALWYLSMDIAPILIGSPMDLHQKEVVSVIFGSVMCVVSYLVDHRTKDDYAFWGYLFGMATLWGGLTMMDSSNEAARFAYCMVNVFFIFLSVFLDRRVFIVFGAMGVSTYIGHLAQKVFADSLMFPVALSGLGLAVIFLGVFYQKNQKRIEERVLGSLTPELLKLRPKSRS
jgi:hypothetical protein